ncbi:hypothetical protein AAY473_038940, partial [Plecturocebus cupreus]
MRVSTLEEGSELSTTPPMTVSGTQPQQRKERGTEIEERGAKGLREKREHSKKVAVCKPRRVPSPEPNHAGILMSGFQPLELQENKFQPLRQDFTMPCWSGWSCTPDLMICMPQLPKVLGLQASATVPGLYFLN